MSTNPGKWSLDRVLQTAQPSKIFLVGMVLILIGLVGQLLSQDVRAWFLTEDGGDQFYEPTIRAGTWIELGFYLPYYTGVPLILWGLVREHKRPET